MPYISRFSSLFLCMFFFLCLFSTRFFGEHHHQYVRNILVCRGPAKKKRELGIGSGIHKFISPVPSCAQLSCVSYYVTTAGLVAGAMITTFMRIMAKYVQREKRSLAARVRNDISSVVKCVREVLVRSFYFIFFCFGVLLRFAKRSSLSFEFHSLSRNPATRVQGCFTVPYLSISFIPWLISLFFRFFFAQSKKKDQNMCINL